MISAFADCKVTQFPIEGGAAFQTLFPSFMNVDWERAVLPLLGWSLPLVVDLEHLAFGSFVGIM